MIRAVVAALAILVSMACGKKDEKAEPAADQPGQSAQPAAGGEAAPAPVANAGKMLATFEDRSITFDVAPGAENYVLGTSFHLLASNADGDRFEIIGKDILPSSFPADIKADGAATIVLRYSAGYDTEWTDEAPTMRIESFDNQTLKGSFSSEMMRPNKPAEPKKIKDGSFELRVVARLR